MRFAADAVAHDVGDRLVLPRLICSLIAFACATAAVALAWAHPLSSVVALTFAVTAIGLFLRWPSAWQFALPAVLPLANWAPWSGWLTFEEFDLLVLAAAAGSYANLAVAPAAAAARGRSKPDLPRLSVVLIALAFFLQMVALLRGTADAGGFSFGWFQGYDEAMNALRSAKGFGLAALMCWPMAQSLQAERDGTVRRLAAGIGCGLASVVLISIYERSAFVGILDFSSEYRTVAAFWEMHVGGAALDGFLALAWPFSAWLLLEAKRPRESIAAALLALLAAYACLATFSRGLYAAILVSAFFLVARVASPTRLADAEPLSAWKRLLRTAGAITIGAFLSWLAFRTGGYRSLIALLGVFILALPLFPCLPGLATAEKLLAVFGGLAFALVATIVASYSSKGAYLAYGLAFVLVAGSVATRSTRARVMTRLAGFAALSGSAPAVALAWGGPRAWYEAAVAVSLLLLLQLRKWRRGGWPTRAMPQGVATIAAVLISATVAVFTAGSYMGDRFGGSERDAAARIEQWRNATRMLRTPDEWAFGKGLGRYPATYYFSAPDGDRPGAYRLNRDSGLDYLTLFGPSYARGYGELLRISQRISPLPGKYELQLDARALAEVTLHFEVCEKHLLYAGECAVHNLRLRAGPWRHYTISLDGSRLGAGPWYAPRLGFFALAIADQGRRADVANLALVGPSGTQLLHNGTFAAGSAHWFFTSDHFHRPWQVDNMFVSALVEQGWIGATALLLLIAVSIWRLGGCSAEEVPWAPFLAASLVGFTVVGLFASLINVPRVAFLFYLLLCTGLLVPRSR